MKSPRPFRWPQHMSISLHVYPNSPGYPRDKSKNIFCTDPLAKVPRGKDSGSRHGLLDSRI